MIKTRHTELRAEMMKRGYDGISLAKEIGITNDTLSSRLCGKSPWTSREMYRIMDVLEMDYSLLPMLFPKDGIQNPKCYKQRITDLPNRNERIKLYNQKTV